MATLQSLYAAAPFWIWFGLAGLLAGLSLSSGRSEPLAPALGAVAVGVVEVLRVRLIFEFELAILILVGGLAIAGRLALAAFAEASQPPAAPAAESTILVGRIARTTGEFVNGVGRVRLDGSEWSAELDFGRDTAPPDALVQVMGVIGGVKLQVRRLEAAE